MCAVYSISPFFFSSLLLYYYLLLLYNNTRPPLSDMRFSLGKSIDHKLLLFTQCKKKKNCDHNATCAGTERNINYYGWPDEISFCKRSRSHGFLAFVTDRAGGESIHHYYRYLYAAAAANEENVMCARDKLAHREQHDGGKNNIKLY